jgi:hypothetical protein
MIEITDEMVEAAGQAFAVSVAKPGRAAPMAWESWAPDIRASLSAVAPLIAAAEREACAKEADSHWKGMPFGNADEAAMDAADAIAAAIRARGGAG